MLWRTTLAVLFILVAAGSLGVWHFTAPADSRPSIQLAASVVVAGAAIYTLYLRVETRRATSASRFIERWNDQSFADLRAKVSDVLTKKLDPKEATQEQRSGIFMTSDFFEEMSIAVHGGGVKEKVLKEFFYTALILTYEALAPWINTRRHHKDPPQPTLYENYEKLYKRWRPKPKR